MQLTRINVFSMPGERQAQRDSASAPNVRSEIEKARATSDEKLEIVHVEVGKVGEEIAQVQARIMDVEAELKVLQREV
jgi:uncharacterized membrane protein